MPDAPVLCWVILAAMGADLCKMRMELARGNSDD